MRLKPFVVFALLLSCAGVQHPSEPESDVAKPEPCAVRDALTKKAIDVANAATANPNDKDLRRELLRAGFEFAVHSKQHHMRDVIRDMSGPLALEPHLKAILSSAEACEDKRMIVVLSADLELRDIAKPGYLRDARACLTGLDAAATCGLVDPKEALALIAEVWPRAAAGERLPMLNAVQMCSEPGQLEANLAFVPEEVRRSYVLLVAAQRAKRQLADELAQAQRDMIESCHSECMKLYGETNSMCRRMCPPGAACGVCGDLGQACYARCGPVPQ